MSPDDAEIRDTDMAEVAEAEKRTDEEAVVEKALDKCERDTEKLPYVDSIDLMAIVRGVANGTVPQKALLLNRPYIIKEALSKPRCPFPGVKVVRPNG